MMVRMEDFGHLTLGLGMLRNPTISLMEYWHPTLDLGRLEHLTLG